MDMARHYYIGDDLEELAGIAQKLKDTGIGDQHLHVLSRSNADIQHYPDLHPVTSFMKRDLVHSAIIGSVIGAVSAVLILIVAYVAGVTETAAGWLPFVMLAIAILGMSTWLGGLRGIQTPNRQFKRFKSVIDNGRHVFFVDVDHTQENFLDIIKHEHPTIEFAGTGKSAPSWLLNLEDRTQHWWYWRMWRHV